MHTQGKGAQQCLRPGETQANLASDLNRHAMGFYNFNLSYLYFIFNACVFCVHGVRVGCVGQSQCCGSPVSASPAQVCQLGISPAGSHHLRERGNDGTERRPVICTRAQASSP